MKKLRIILAFLLFPLSIIYGILVFFRNKMYDQGILKSHAFKMPLISVGNITVGGTGKTPHIEYLADLLREEFDLAILSRGYKRKSKGFQMVTPESNVRTAGDEPLQVKRKFPEITVAVDRKRVHGVQALRENQSGLDLVLLDDAFQHRKIKVNLSILLIDYNHPISKDFLLPLGNLREQAHEKRRANIIIITKSPPDLQPIQRRVLLKKLRPYPYQSVFFTTYQYGAPLKVFGPGDNNQVINENNNIPGRDTTVFLVTGIANPALLKDHIEENYSSKVQTLTFPDHKFYTKRTVKKIQRHFGKIEGNKIIVTTEKDAVRFREISDFPEELKKQMYYIPVNVKFLNNRTSDFNRQILEYVRKNKKHSFLYPG
jgi:tetraacyldisaccharide 4'-kinase